MSESQLDTLITLATFENGFQANLLKAKLIDAGIEAFVFDENVMTLNPLYSNMVGGIKVKIKKSDASVALEILKEIKNTPLTNEADEIITCPKCNSTNLGSGLHSIKSMRSLIAYFFAILTFTLPLFTDNSYYCLDCKNIFKR